MNKRGDMTFQQIAIAVLVLIVLVVLIIIFSNNINILDKETNSCSTKGGKCETAEKGCGAGIARWGNYTDCKKPNLCCMSFG
jgi:hypothetical protein